jgi:hypothetical protein
MKNSNVNYNCTLVNAPLINVNYFIKRIEGVFCKHDKSFKLQSKCNHNIFVIPKLIIRDITICKVPARPKELCNASNVSDGLREKPSRTFLQSEIVVTD